ncbi:hypothetical protein CEXT_327011 [Caerostris extrusa]|uniref:Uncharacterized protein n=1 Tax=Caerostris extrusa TaxID=172846 RepID=A0AAV4SUY9_CAEEX|nr:hypothetical protein CEXT_327011 [Caerostris extrusa]
MRADAIRSISITRQGLRHFTSLQQKKKKEGCPNKITPILNRKCVTRSQIRQTTNTAGRVHSEGALAGKKKRTIEFTGRQFLDAGGLRDIVCSLFIHSIPLIRTRFFFSSVSHLCRSLDAKR